MLLLETKKPLRHLGRLLANDHEVDTLATCVVKGSEGSTYARPRVHHNGKPVGCHRQACADRSHDVERDNTGAPCMQVLNGASRNTG
jgi:hypothetical protein